MQSLEAADETENTFNLYEEFSKFNSCSVSGDPVHEDLDAALFDIHHSGLLESVDSFVPAPAQPQSNGHEIEVTHHNQLEEDRIDQILLDQESNIVKQEEEEEDDSNKESILADLGLKQDGSTQLGKLVRQQNLNFVTLTIHSETQFSIQLPNRAEVMFPLTPDTHDQFLTLISSNKIPTILYDYILTCSMAEQLFYSGCLIVYVQNYTRTLSCSSKYFTLLGRDYSHHFKDLNHMRASLPTRKDWSCKSLNQIESQLLNPPSNSPSTSLNSTKLNLDVREPCAYEKLIRDHRSRLAFAKPSIRRCTRQATQSLHRQRKHKLSEYGEQVARMNYLYELCKKNQKSEQSDVTKTNRGSSAATKSEKREPDTEQEKLLAFKFGVSQIGRLSKRYERPPDTNDWYPRLVEEYILEAERGESRVYNKVSVSRRPTNGEFLGQMYVDHEYKEDGPSQSGASYKFTLGSRRQTNRYIHQFIEIFTEKGCKSVKLTHVVAGQPAKVSCTKAMQEKQQQQAAAQQQRKPVLQVLNSQQQAPLPVQPQSSSQPASTLKTLIQSAVTPQRTVLQQQLCSPSVSSQQLSSTPLSSQQLLGVSSQQQLSSQQLSNSALSQHLTSPSVSNQQLSSTALTQQLTSQALSQQLSSSNVSSQLSNTALSQQLNSPSVSNQLNSQQLNSTVLSQQLSSPALSQQLGNSALSQQLNSSALSQQLSSPSLSQQLNNSALSQQLSQVSSQPQQYTVQTSQPSQHITLIQTSGSSSSQQQLPQLQIQIQQHQQNQQQQQQRPRVIIQNQQTGQSTTFLHQISKSELEAQIQEHNQQMLLKQQLQQQQQEQQKQVQQQHQHISIQFQPT
uniref:Coagulation factor V n=1 Tax=Cacopsylla melanoneura TaxID=428564 RepID=A0A8D9ARD5_9HEMI